MTNSYELTREIFIKAQPGTIFSFLTVESKMKEWFGEIIESDPNGCSLGSNGQTIAKIYFDSRHNLTKIQVYKNYIASNYKMELIEEREY